MLGLDDPTPKQMLKAWRKFHEQIAARVKRSDPGADRVLLKYLNETICPDERKCWAEKMEEEGSDA